MQNRCIRLLRWLLALHLCLGLAIAAEAPASSAADPQLAAVAQIQAASNALDAVRKSLDDADAAETLQNLSEKTLKAKRDADDASTTLEPLLKQIDARIAQLGPVTAGVEESPELTAQRKELAQQRSDLDSAIKSGKLLSVEAKQTADNIEKIRTQQFNQQIARKVASPLSPSLWKQFGEHMPADLQRIMGLVRQGQASFQSAIAKHGWGTPLLGTLIALVLMFPLRIWLRSAGRKFAASERAPNGRLRRSGLAVWMLLVGTALPGLASMVFIESLHSIDAIAPRLESVADAWIRSTFVAAFFLSVSASLLVPKRPTWRLLNIDDIAAPALTRFAWGAAALTWFSMMLNAVDIAARTSAVSSVALDGLIALTYVGLIMSVLVIVSRQRQRQQQVDREKAAAHQGEEHRPARTSNWLMFAWLGGHLTVLAALIAALLGYLNFSVFVATQMVWITVVVLATTLLMKFADDFFIWLCSAESRIGQGIALGTGLKASRVEQIGVLLSALMRVCLLLLGLVALTAPFGNSSSLAVLADSLTNGLPVGDAVLKPMTMVRGLVVLIAGLTIFRTFQHWLVETYLPKTELDIGARNSISTVARYVGIILSGLWTLAALGIGFEKVALLASALSVGIGFGLQAITQNFVSGLILLAERPVKLGDRVRIGDQVGDIRRISVRATEIQTDDKSTVIVPNSEFITKSVQNLTMDGSLGRISIAFAVPLNTDIVKLREVLLGLYEEHENVLALPAPAMYVDSINGSVINIASFGHVSSSRNVYSTRSDLLFGLLQRCAEQGIALSSATDIHIIQDKAAPAEPKENPEA
ncbi:mechanosensitive ion channel family protein [Comamonas testosteroni]|uniref:Mechanosensitive ion channel family protein n=1 Tax=Comamonas testosteroni TaxID=285 RepID=A0A373FQ55_COMTE|nr:DUF3772 domain-containing protein [Comamonas testosteroni]RGE46017.1 mechanosensitive ion channel family protein [Comamonas testosteroni]